MPPKLRPFQLDLERDCYAAWATPGVTNIIPVSATGSGKTVLLSKMLYDEPGAGIAIAHRQELVSQISIALARNGVRHRVVGARKGSSLVRIITALQVSELGYSFLDPNARTGVGGVDTIIKIENDPWFNQVRLQVQDEGHHVLRDNKWGRVAAKFPHARGLFPTATPARADGRGLGRHADGITDALVLAPSMRDIIRMGYLTDYRIFAPPSDLDLSQVEISKTTGDFNVDQVRKAVRKSTVTGDVVSHYLRLAKGKLGVTFAVDVEEATKNAQLFREAGVPAEVVSAKTPDDLRAHILRRFRRKEILQLVNVDLFGEGFDLPAIEVVSFARPTDSFPLYSQQFGRVLRLMLPDDLQPRWGDFSDCERLAFIAQSEKPVGMVLDHVGNVVRFNGPPDRERTWTLDRRERRKKKRDDEIPIVICLACYQPFERVKKRCPYCDNYTPPGSRGGVEFVDGDLTELDPELLAAMRKEKNRIDGDFHPPVGLPYEAQKAAFARHFDRREQQKTLRNAIAWWAGLEAHRGHGESESYRRFWFKFGVDVAGAQCLGTRDAEELTNKIYTELGKFGIDGTVNAELFFANS